MKLVRPIKTSKWNP